MPVRANTWLTETPIAVDPSPKTQAVSIGVKLTSAALPSRVAERKCRPVSTAKWTVSPAAGDGSLAETTNGAGVNLASAVDVETVNFTAGVEGDAVGLGAVVTLGTGFGVTVTLGVGLETTGANGITKTTLGGVKYEDFGVGEGVGFGAGFGAGLVVTTGAGLAGCAGFAAGVGTGFAGVTIFVDATDFTQTVRALASDCAPWLKEVAPPAVQAQDLVGANCSIATIIAARVRVSTRVGFGQFIEAS